VKPKGLERIQVPLTEKYPGTFGSGIAYDPRDGAYWLVTDGRVGNAGWRLYLLRVRVDGETAEVTRALPIREGRKALTGNELDPEGLALAPDGTLWLCDEKGPFLVHVDRQGRVLQRVRPSHLLSGRAANRGLEGVAVSPDGGKIFTILQEAAGTDDDRLNAVLGVYDLASKTWKHHRYRLEDPARLDYPAGLSPHPRTGAHDLFALEAGRLLVLERDNQQDGAARVKRIYRVTVPAEPTDVPLEKELVLDLLASGYARYPFAQPEGLSVHDHFLVVVNDNDADPKVPTELWRFRL
jgi:hypothetical protein